MRFMRAIWVNVIQNDKLPFFQRLLWRVVVSLYLALAGCFSMFLAVLTGFIGFTVLLASIAGGNPLPALIGWVIWFIIFFPVSTKWRLFRGWLPYPYTAHIRRRFSSSHKEALLLWGIYDVLAETGVMKLPARGAIKLVPRGEGVWRLDLRTPQGMNDDGLIRVAPYIKSSLRLIRVSTVDLDDRAGVVSMLLANRNVLDSDLGSAPVLGLSADEFADPNYWLPVGIDEDANPVELPLFLTESGGVRTAHAGGSGAGKSGIVRQQLLFASCCPSIDTAVIDGKGSEFGYFKPYSTRFLNFAESGVDGFDSFLDWMESEISRRAQLLSAHKDANPRRVSDALNPTDDGVNYLLWVWDELGVVLGGYSPTAQKKIQSRLYGIVSVVRSLGISVVWSSQTFKSEVVSTQVRSQFDSSVGYWLASSTESGFLGFAPSDTVRPDLIGGKYLHSGRRSTVGQFALRGLGRQSFGKSYYVSNDEIVSALRAHGVKREGVN